MRKPLCVLLRRCGALCTQMFVPSVEGCGSEAHCPAAAVCSGCVIGLDPLPGVGVPVELRNRFWAVNPETPSADLVWLLSKVSWLL